MLKIAIIGAGARGKDSYAIHMKNFKLGATVTAVVEPIKERREQIQKMFDIRGEHCFENEKDFYEANLECDGVIIANQDKDHFHSILKCIEKNYVILLEKPITSSKEELEIIEYRLKKSQSRIMVCHVLRYTPFYKTIKELLDDGIVGTVIGIDHTEYIGNYHMAHSFVRGHWRDKEASSPIILSKTCHDMDLLAWFTNSKTKRIESIGKLNYFKKENMPVGATKKCSDCPYENTCIYSATKFYIDPLPEGWAVHLTPNLDEENVRKILANSNFGSCVYKMDNNVCDHQLVQMEFENGIQCNFTLTAFTNNQYRETKIYGTKGSIIANTLTNKIEIIPFYTTEETQKDITTIIPEVLTGRHGGGDLNIIKDFILFMSDANYIPSTNIAHSFQSHYMCYEAEENRLSKYSNE